ncbi:MAG: QueT transporter family protein [Oscillospiraceae bacterium]|nr:QueT transporter family protein [Oscillospiraceae bacterium]
MLKEIKTRQIAFGAVLTAVYVVLTVINPLSFPAIQFRISEILVLVCFYNPFYCIPMILGCFTANLFSPYGIADALLGTLATALAVIPMVKMKNIWLASLLPVFTNAVIIGIMLHVMYELPLFFNVAMVGLGQFTVVTIIGAPLFKVVLEKNKLFMSIICTDLTKNK